jgi:hypothetical protein
MKHVVENNNTNEDDEVCEGGDECGNGVTDSIVLKEANIKRMN